MGNRKVLVTGAAGTIGTVLLPHLTRIGPVFAIDTQTPAEAPPGVDWIAGSVADTELLNDLMQECGYVVHLARDNPASWASLSNVDINGTRNVFEAARLARSSIRFVFASSLHPVGRIESDHLAGKMTEADETEAFGPLRPDSEYAVAKAFGEAYGRYIAETTDVLVSCLRIGTVRPVDDPSLYLDEAGFEYIPGGQAGVARRLRSTWLNHADLRAIVTEELQAEDKFRLRFAVSDHRFWPSATYVWNPA